MMLTVVFLAADFYVFCHPNHSIDATLTPRNTKKQQSSAVEPKARNAAAVQKNLSDSRQSLLIRGENDKKLTPRQIKFNRLVKQIQKLETSIQAQTQTLEQMQAYYLKEVTPVIAQEDAVRIRYVKALFIFYKRKRKALTDEEHRFLEALLLEQYEMITDDQVETDPELQAIHKKLYNQRYEDTLSEDFHELKLQTVEYLRFNGVNVPDDIFDTVEDMDQMHQKVTSIMDEFAGRQQTSEPKADAQHGFGFDDRHKKNRANGTKRPNKRAEAQKKRNEEKTALKHKSISSIYKQLAKLIHPDLELDRDKKAEKEALMQQLTSAYRNKDFHALLQLELKWVQKEENNIDQLADEKLSLYIEILQEQAVKLKMEAGSLKWHPKYASVMEFSDGWQPSLSDMKATLQELKTAIKHITISTAKLNKNDSDSIEELKDLIEQFAIEYAYWDDDGEDDDFDFADFDTDELF